MSEQDLGRCPEPSLSFFSQAGPTGQSGSTKAEGVSVPASSLQDTGGRGKGPGQCHPQPGCIAASAWAAGLSLGPETPLSA